MLNTYIIMGGFFAYNESFEKRKWLIGGAGVYLGLVGFSRVHLGMHGLD